MGDAFDSLLEKHKDSVYRQLVRLCGNREDAEDALIEALTNAFRALGNLEDDQRLRAWLGTIATRTCARLKSHKGASSLIALAQLEEEGFELASLDANPEQAAIESEMRACIHHAVDSLPPIYQEVYKLRDLEERPAPEVAKALGITIPAVKSRLHRARSLVRASMDQSICAEPS